MMTMKLYAEHFGRSRVILFSQRKSYSQLPSSYASDVAGLQLQIPSTFFLGDFRSYPVPEIVRDSTLQPWHQIYLYRSSNSKITSDVITASLYK